MPSEVAKKSSHIRLDNTAMSMYIVSGTPRHKDKMAKPMYNACALLSNYF